MVSSLPLKNASEAIARIAIKERMSAYSARPCPSSRRRNENKVASFRQNSWRSDALAGRARVQQLTSGSSVGSIPPESLPRSIGDW